MRILFSIRARVDDDEGEVTVVMDTLAKNEIQGVNMVSNAKMAKEEDIEVVAILKEQSFSHMRQLCISHPFHLFEDRTYLNSGSLAAGNMTICDRCFCCVTRIPCNIPVKMLTC